MVHCVEYLVQPYFRPIRRTSNITTASHTTNDQLTQYARNAKETVAQQ